MVQGFTGIFRTYFNSSNKGGMKEKAIIREQKQGYNTHYELIIKKSVKDVKAKSMKSL